MQAKPLVWLALLLAGCPDRTISAIIPEQRSVEVKDIPAVARRKIDILFQIDSSGSMQEEQVSLRANFPRFIEVLESIQGGLPDIHIGVITPDMGASATDGSTFAGITGCAGRGKDGALRQLPGDTIRYLADEIDGAGNRVRNYPGTLAEAFSSLADVGLDGCGIEQHLEATRRALDNHPSNAGFLRDDAYLAVIVIADEDDCSLAKSTLFQGVPSDSFGERVNFRCIQESVACDTPATPFEDASGVRRDCRPRDSQIVTPISRYVDFLKGQKRDPLDVLVAAIVGPTDPFRINQTASGVTSLASSCLAGTSQLAIPAVRTSSFLAQFEQRNTLATICDADLSGALTEIAAAIKVLPGERCFENDLADADPDVDGDQYECSITEYRRVPGRTDQELGVIPACGGGASPCWRIEEDPVECFYTEADPHLKLVIDRTGAAPGSDIFIKANCVTTDSSGPAI
ncbi:MAG: hypothetical protein WKG01_19130 [Kofleriaceae bacterium]